MVVDRYSHIQVNSQKELVKKLESSLYKTEQQKTAQTIPVEELLEAVKTA